MQEPKISWMSWIYWERWREIIHSIAILYTVWRLTPSPFESRDLVAFLKSGTQDHRLSFFCLNNPDSYVAGEFTISPACGVNSDSNSSISGVVPLFPMLSGAEGCYRHDFTSTQSSFSTIFSIKNTKRTIFQNNILYCLLTIIRVRQFLKND